MLIQVFGFLISTLGWIFVSCTIGMDYWRISYIGGQGGSWIIKAAWYWSTLWRDCYVDSSDVANCRDFDIMWVVRPGARAEQGLPVFLGLVGSAGILLGSALYAATLCRTLKSNRLNCDYHLLDIQHIETMKRRTVIMYIEMGSFVICVIGWMLVCATMPMEYWSFSEVASTVLTTNYFHSNLWKDCTTDSTGMVDCKVFPTLLALQTYIHLCRALIIISIVFGLFGAILALIGMKCTKLGGSEIANARVTFAAGVNYLTSGLCSIFAYSSYGHKVVSEFLDPSTQTQKFELGPALYIGWSGSVLVIVGGLVFIIFGGKEGCHSRYNSFYLYKYCDLIMCNNFCLPPPEGALT
ncbi:Claudin-10 [Bagarius yarrelli]|uniref:Claudin-10 n=1 Tax=Bagarius yarrelli TaxID=175774 RepID=A0A556UZ99_BAGYA|nr:Claudin-10 [Bagarius yarrelli]